MINRVMALLEEVSMVMELTGHSGSPVMPIPKSVAQVRALFTDRIERGVGGGRAGGHLASLSPTI